MIRHPKALRVAVDHALSSFIYLCSVLRQIVGGPTKNDKALFFSGEREKGEHREGRREKGETDRGRAETESIDKAG